MSDVKPEVTPIRELLWCSMMQNLSAISVNFWQEYRRALVCGNKSINEYLPFLYFFQTNFNSITTSIQYSFKLYKDHVHTMFPQLTSMSLCCACKQISFPPYIDDALKNKKTALKKFKYLKIKLYKKVTKKVTMKKIGKGYRIKNSWFPKRIFYTLFYEILDKKQLLF